jgi:hypothetical protein
MVVERDMTATVAAHPTSGVSLATISSMVTGVALVSAGAWSAAAEKIAPLLENPTSLAAAVDAHSLAPAVSELIKQGADDLVRNIRSKLEVIYEIGVRIAELRDDAKESGELFSESSQADFSKFVSRLALTRRPSIFLLDNGNLRAVWDNEKKELIGLQFLGDGSIQFVMFRLKEGTEIMDRTSGIADFSEISGKLDSLAHMIW